MENLNEIKEIVEETGENINELKDKIDYQKTLIPKIFEQFKIRAKKADENIRAVLDYLNQSKCETLNKCDGVYDSENFINYDTFSGWVKIRKSGDGFIFLAEFNRTRPPQLNQTFSNVYDYICFLESQYSLYFKETNVGFEIIERIDTAVKYCENGILKYFCKNLKSRFNELFIYNKGIYEKQENFLKSLNLEKELQKKITYRITIEEIEE